MTVLLFALGSAGDVHPNVGLALALQKRGHRVVLVASVVFESLARRVGLDMLAVGTEREYKDALRDPDIWHPYRAFSVVARRLILPSMREGFRIVEQYSRSGDVVVAAPATAFGARIAQEKLGVPLVTVHLQPTMLRSVYSPPAFGFPDIIGHLPRSLRRAYLRAVDRYVIDPLLAPVVNAFRTELGLASERRLFDHWMHSPQLVLGLFPSWFSSPQPDWPPNVHLTGFPLYDESDLRPPADGLAEFLEAGDPPIVFTAGSAHAFSAEFFRASVEACRAGGWRGVLLTQFPEQLPQRLPDGIRHFDYVPFSRVLPRAAAFVHHGGIGTTAQALAAGVPQLVVPFAHDQPDNAVRVRRLGVGDFLLPGRYKARALIRDLRRVTESATIGENCRRRARDLAGSKPLDDACTLIEGRQPG
jgi:rhamnosyltransferase subunit B